MQICLDIENVRDNMRVLWWEKYEKVMRRLGRKAMNPRCRGPKGKEQMCRK
jgi:hypothetical protein